MGDLRRTQSRRLGRSVSQSRTEPAAGEIQETRVRSRIGCLLIPRMSRPVLMTEKTEQAKASLSLVDIRAARDRIRDSIYLSPCPRSENFSQLTGNSVYLKLDNLQRTGAFKERGALNRLLTLNLQERSRGVIAASAGNHAQGVAYHAGRHGVRAQI